MDTDQKYKLKYQKYKTKYGLLKQQQGGLRRMVGDNYEYIGADGQSKCTVPVASTFIITPEGKRANTYAYSGSSGGIHIGNDNCVVKEQDTLDCVREYKILQRIQGVPGVIRTIGEDCDGMVNFFMLEQAGVPFSHYNKLSPEIKLLVQPYIKALVPEILCTLHTIHYKYNIAHCDCKLDNILWSRTQDDVRKCFKYTIIDFGMATLYRADKVVFDEDTDKTKADIPRTQYNNIKYVTECANEGLHTTPECQSVLSLCSTNAILSIDIRQQSTGCRHVYACADMYPVITQFIYLLMDITKDDIDTPLYDNIHLYDTSNLNEFNLVNFKRYLTNIQFYVDPCGIIQIKMPPNKHISQYSLIPSTDYFDHVTIVHQLNELVGNIVSGKITSLPIYGPIDHEKLFNDMYEIISIYDRMPVPYVQIPTDIAIATGLKIVDISPLSDGEFIDSIFKYMTTPPDDVVLDVDAHDQQPVKRKPVLT
jgi:hypothetical protein